MRIFPLLKFSKIKKNEKEGGRAGAIIFKNQLTKYRFFIDRDPKHFGKVLNYLRDKEVHNKGLEPWELEELASDFEFYKINIPSVLQQYVIFYKYSAFLYFPVTLQKVHKPSPVKM